MKEYAPKRFNPKSNASIFKNIVKDYTGEYPCFRCMNAASHKRLSTEEMDNAIIKKLFKTATNKYNFSQYEINNARQSIARFFNPPERTAIDKNIAMTIATNGRITYRYIVQINKKQLSGTCDSLEEAIQERDILLNKKEKKEIGKQIQTRICKNINKITNSVTKNISFFVTKTIDWKDYNKSFKTLEEAKNYIDSITGLKQ